MHIIARPVLKRCWVKHPNSEEALKLWYKNVNGINVKDFNELKKLVPNIRSIGNNRVIFNIKGNEFRIVAVIIYKTGKVYIRFVGSHEEYNRIDATTI